MKPFPHYTLCWGPCPQKMVEIKDLGIVGYCPMKAVERPFKDRIIDMYESSLNLIKQNAIK